MFLESHQISNTYTLYAIGDSVLERVSSEKDPGVIFDNTLSFEEHIVHKVKKANSLVSLIRRSFLHLSLEMFRTLYRTFCQTTWNMHKQCVPWKHINLIESVQRRAMRIVSALRQFSYEDRLQRLNIPTMEFRRSMGDLVEVYKHELKQLFVFQFWRYKNFLKSLQKTKKIL